MARKKKTPERSALAKIKALAGKGAREGAISDVLIFLEIRRLAAGALAVPAPQDGTTP